MTVTFLLKDVNDATSLHISPSDFSKAGNGEKRYKDVSNNGDGWNPILIQVKKLQKKITKIFFVELIFPETPFDQFFPGWFFAIH